MLRQRCEYLGIWLVAICLVCVLGAGYGNAADTGQGPYLSINGQVTEMPTSVPILALGEVLVPLQDLMAAIGGQVYQGSGQGQYVVTYGGTNIELTVDQQQYRVNGQERNFYILPIMVGEVVYVDVQDIVQAFGGRYGWDPGTLTGDITFGGAAPAGQEGAAGGERPWDDGPHVSIGGQIVQMPTSVAILALGEVLTPLQDLAAAIGGQVQQGSGQGQYVMTFETDTIELTANEQNYSFNGQERSFYILPIMVGQVVYVDVRDIVEALGGQYTWNQATLTAALSLGGVAGGGQPQPADTGGGGAAEGPPGGRAVTGALVYIAKDQQPPLFLVQADGDAQAQAYTGGAGIQYFRSSGYGQDQVSSLQELQRDDRVELVVNNDNEVLQITVLGDGGGGAVGGVNGTIDFIGQGLILLNTAAGRQNFQVAAGTQAQTAAGAPYVVESLQTGDQVTVVPDATGRVAQTIILQSAGAAGGTGPTPGGGGAAPAGGQTPTELSITFPEQGYRHSDPDQAIRIRGEAPPGSDIRVRVEYKVVIKTDVLNQQEVKADAQGQWQTEPLRLEVGDLKALVVDKFKVIAMLLDEQGKPAQVKSVTVRVEKGGGGILDIL